MKNVSRGWYDICASRRKSEGTAAVDVVRMGQIVKKHKKHKVGQSTLLRANGEAQ